jgi:hypothetical protein
MKNTQDILTELATVTREIEDKYPELQKYLKETRSTLPKPTKENSKIDNSDLEDYLEELKDMVKKYKQK